jgi:hypothetical protein
MRPGAEYLVEDDEFTGVGELNQYNELHGRGIEIYDCGTITIGFFENGKLSTGNYIRIYRNGKFKVGEKCIEDGVKMNRGTVYRTDGTESQYDE